MEASRSTYYAVINHVISQREIDYNKFSDEVKYYYDKSKGRYGAIKIQRDLEEAGIPCSVKRVQRHMAKLGLRSVVVRKYKYQNNQGGNAVRRRKKTICPARNDRD
jgi:transposase InsO family protein